MKILRIVLFFFCLATNVYAREKVLNIYTWSGEIPDVVVRQFEKQTGIKVNLATYENNEVMYAKLRATKHPGYDIIVPSSYFVDRMRKQNMLQPLDRTKILFMSNLNPRFSSPPYDPGLHFSVPYLWGVTGIFYHADYYAKHAITQWKDLWDPRYVNQIMLLDDVRETFGIALMSLGYSPNDHDPAHIKAAYERLKALMANIKVFSSDTVVSIIIDEDVTLGSAWNGDVYKATQENAKIRFVFPKEGFVIWVDSLCIPRDAPHQDNAYAFINFVMQPEIAKLISSLTSFPTANSAAQHLLPPQVRNNPVAYPPAEVLKRGQFQTDLSEETIAIYEKYWEILKMGG